MDCNAKWNSLETAILGYIWLSEIELKWID